MPPPRHSPRHSHVSVNNGGNFNSSSQRRSNSSTTHSPAMRPQMLPSAAHASSSSPSAHHVLPAAATPKNPPIGALLKHLPTTELTELEIAIRSIMYVLSDNLCPVVKQLNEKRRHCVNDVRDMLKASACNTNQINTVGGEDLTTLSELYGSGRTGLTACTSSDLDFVVVLDCSPHSVVYPESDAKNNGMSAFYRPPLRLSTSTSTGGSSSRASGSKRQRDKDDESLFFEDGFDSEDDYGSLRNPSSPTGINNVGLTRSQRRREMGPLIRTLIGYAAQYRKGNYLNSINNSNSARINSPNSMGPSRHQMATQNRHVQRYGNSGPPVFVGFKPIIHAKVPLLKCTHRATQLEVDLSFALDGAKSSDYLISRLNSQKPQCMAAARGLIVLLKHLLHEADLNDPSVGGLGSFPLCLMVVWFLESEVHKNFPIELQGSYTVLLTRFFAYFGDTFDATKFGIDLAGKEMFSKANSNVLILKNPLDKSLNAASACTKYYSDVRPLFQRLQKAFMAAMSPRSVGANPATNPPPALIAERLFKKALISEQHKRCYSAFAETLKSLARDAPSTKAPNFTPTFLKSVLAPVTTHWGDEMVCEMEGIGLGTQW